MNRSKRKIRNNRQAEADKLWPRVVYLADCLRSKGNPCQAIGELRNMMVDILHKAREEYLQALNS